MTRSAYKNGCNVSCRKEAKTNKRTSEDEQTERRDWREREKRREEREEKRRDAEERVERKEETLVLETVALAGSFVIVETLAFRLPCYRSKPCIRLLCYRRDPCICGRFCIPMVSLWCSFYIIRRCAWWLLCIVTFCTCGYFACKTFCRCLSFAL